MRWSKLATGIGVVCLLAFAGLAVAKGSYREQLCQNEGYHCLKITKGQTWYSLFPDPYERDLVKRINRMNTSLRTGMTIAVPDDLSIDTNLIAPFPKQYDTEGVKTVVVAPGDLAWAAYDEQGNLVKWGPSSAGQSYCKDIERRCTTPSGSFMVYSKGGAGCVSTKFPVGEGGAPMPYCMFFNGGYALHGSPLVPGYNASHGCVRLFTEDARWLNHEFTPGGKARVIILPYSARANLIQ